MQIYKTFRILIIAALLAVPVAAFGQNSSINAFSPYTFYGLGDIGNQGPAFIRSMGGAGVAFRDPGVINFTNPAAMSAMPRKAFILNVGAEGSNYYLKNSLTKTSFNNFNIRDIAIQFPLGRGIAFGLSVTPFSSVGYRLQQREDNPLIVANVGDVRYNYSGEGDLTQMKAGIGWEIGGGFSVGAELVYYLGDIRRVIDVEVTSITGDGYYGNSKITQDLHVSHLSGNFGFQYSPIFTDRRNLTIGGTYQPQVKLNPEHTKKYTGTNGFRQIEYLLSDNLAQEFTLPQNFAVGIFYNTSKISLGAEYKFQEWAKHNKDSETEAMSFRNSNIYKAGLSYTPSRYDVRSYMKRVTYRIGLRYGDYYMKFNGHDLTEKAVTLGFGFPISLWGLSNINVGFEYGRRGTTKHNLILENYFKFSVGLSLFGTDDWFKKYRYE